MNKKMLISGLRELFECYYTVELGPIDKVDTLYVSLAELEKLRSISITQNKTQHIFLW